MAPGNHAKNRAACVVAWACSIASWASATTIGVGLLVGGWL
jgi:hypothetical protein